MLLDSKNEHQQRCSRYSIYRPHVTADVGGEGGESGHIKNPSSLGIVVVVVVVVVGQM
jgi:hypothetical protein